jgi:hypothetical protein
MATKLLKGGYAGVEFSSVSTFATLTEILRPLKAGTFITPETQKDDFADGSVGAAGKTVKIGVRSADVDNTAGSAYALLKTAEEASTPTHFRYVGIQNAQMIHDCETAWDEQAVANVTQSADAVNFKVGLKSAKFDILVAASTGIVGSKAITALDLTTRKGLTLWIKSNVALNANDFQILLDDTALCASPIETLNIPAVLQNVWTKVYLPFATPASLTAVVAVGLKMAVDKGAIVVNIDDVRALADHVNVLNVIPQVEFEHNEQGKFSAMRVTGQAAGAAESDVLALNV